MQLNILSIPLVTLNLLFCNLKLLYFHYIYLLTNLVISKVSLFGEIRMKTSPSFIPFLYRILKGNTFIKKDGEQYSISMGYSELCGKLVSLNFDPSQRNLKITHLVFQYLLEFFNYFSKEDEYWNSQNIRSVIQSVFDIFPQFSIEERESLTSILTDFIIWIIETSYPYKSNSKPKFFETDLLKHIHNQAQQRLH